jgi:NADH-quinone oxidoreductase subunit J
MDATMITPQIAVFLVLAAVVVAGAVSLILQRHPIHSALSLIVVMVALAGLYLLQGAEFVAAVQIIVYAGAIMVLFVFVIMLLNAGEEERTNVSRMARFVGVPLGAVFLLEVAYWIGKATAHLGSAPPEAVSTRDLSTLLFREFVFPFELTSFLILIALLGAMVLARREESD